MCKTSFLEECAEEICSASKIISAYCLLEGRPEPSFSPQAPSIAIPADAPQKVLEAQKTLLSVSTNIQQLITGPAEYLPSLQIHYQYLSCLRWLCHFNILACIPLHGSVPYKELAGVSGVPEAQLRSVIRMIVTSNFLCEPTPGEVAHNSVSSGFVTNPGLVDWAIFMTDLSMPVAAKLADATKKFGNTSQKNETAYNIAMNTDLPLFDFVKKSPELTKQFAGYMKNVQTSSGTDIKHLLNVFDWESLGDSFVVDVGGSSCSSALALGAAFPKLRFIVEDLPETIAGSNGILSRHSEEIRSRITVHGHNFFTPQPISYGRVYLLRMILHDWPDAEALTILANHLEVLKANPASRLVIMDTVLPVPGTIGRTEEALLRVRDLTMIQTFNAKEREESEFVDLFTRTCDSEGCLVLKGSVKPFGSFMTGLEVAYEKFGVNGH